MSHLKCLIWNVSSESFLIKCLNWNAWIEMFKLNVQAKISELWFFVNFTRSKMARVRRRLWKIRWTFCLENVRMEMQFPRIPMLPAMKMKSPSKIHSNTSSGGTWQSLGPAVAELPLRSSSFMMKKMKLKNI